MYAIRSYYGLKDGRLTPFNEKFNMDTETSVASKSKIDGLTGVQYVFTAHYGFAEYNTLFDSL